jgi:hypothetical protein
MLQPTVSAARKEAQLTLLSPIRREALSSRFQDLLTARDRPSAGKSELSPLQAPKQEMASGPNDESAPARVISPRQKDQTETLAPEAHPRFAPEGITDWWAVLGSLDLRREHPVCTPAVAVRPEQPDPGQLLERWVRRVALGGDRHRAVARLELGHGELAGATLTVTAEAGAVAIELDLPDARDALELEQRVRERLARRGFSADVTVR